VIYARRQDPKSTEAALAYFDQAEKHYQSNNDAEGRGEVFYQRAAMYVTRRDSKNAREQIERAIANANAIDDKYLEIRARLQLSNVLQLEGKSFEAKKYASEALEFAKTSNREVLTVNGLVVFGFSFFNTDLAQAERYFQQALDVADYYQTRRSKVRALLSLASVESQRHSRPEKIRAYVDRALPIIKEDVYRKFEMQAHELLGHAYLQQGDYDIARQAFERELELAKEYGDRDQLSRGYEGHGLVMQAKEDYPAALSDFEQNLKWAQVVGLATGIANAKANRANVLWRLGRYDEAKQSLSESQQMVEEKELEGELPARLKLIAAEMALSIGSYSLAESEARMALKRAGEFEAVAIQASSLIGLAQAHSGRTEAGAKSCDGAVEVARRLSTPHLLSAALLALAAAQLDSGETQAALLNVKEALETFNRSGQLESAWRALSLAAQASMRVGDHASAQAYRSDAAKVLADFGQRFDAHTYQRYLERFDVRNQRRFVIEVAGLKPANR
jgi:tetratricopeptide (TPR) repeat protein